MITVLFTTTDQVGVVTINRPEALNALSSALLTDLAAVLEQARGEKVRALVVTGAGDKAFAAGADIAQMAAMTPAEAQDFSQRGQAVLRALETLPAPTIAAVSGFALGGGCELALACDLRLASTTARFGQPEVGLGIIPGFGATQRLARLVGPGLAKQIIFSAQPIDATRALAIGLVNAVVEPGELMPEALKLARRMAAQAPGAVRAAKLAIDAAGEGGIATGMALETALFATCFATDDQHEAMTAFLEKRPAAPFRDK